MGFRLGIDFGTSHTVAVLRWPDGRAKPLLFDGSPLLPSAVYLDAAGRFAVGRDAAHSARMDPGGYEPNPKRRIDDGSVLLGGREVATVELIGTVLGRVAEEATRTAGEPPAAVTVTYPAAWGTPRRLVLAAAAAHAGLGKVRLVEEPVAAATYFGQVLGHRMAAGNAVVVYDFGGGTFDVSLVERTADGFRTVAVDGRDDIGGLDLDEALIRRIGEVYGVHDPDAWRRLAEPASMPERRQRRLFLDDVRAAKERLSRHPTAELYVPGLDRDAHLTREEFEAVARPLLDETVRLTERVVRESGFDRERIAGVFLVGGSSRIPLVSTLVHRALGIAPTAIEQPELVVAEGSILVRRVTASVPVSAPVSPAPVSPAPVSSVPVSAVPVSAVPVPVTGAAAPVAGAAAVVTVSTAVTGASAGTGRPRRWLVAAAALTVLALVATGIVMAPHLLPDRQERKAPRKANTTANTVPLACTVAAPVDTSATVAPGTPAAQSYQAPDNWTLHTDPTGFRLAVPTGWTTNHSGTTICFKNPHDDGFLAVGQWAQPDHDTLGYAGRKERQVAAALPGYHKVSIERTDYFGTAAVWEFTYTGKGGDVMRGRAVDLVGPGNRGYSLLWCTYDASWQNSLPDYSLVLGGFQPAQ